MASYAYSPLVWDLTTNPRLTAKVYSSGITADADGFYYKAGDLVEISGDETVKKAENVGAAIGILDNSVSVRGNPEGIADSRIRISVIPFGYSKVIEMVAEGNLTAGTRVCQGTTSKQAVKAMSNAGVTSVITAKTQSGETAVKGTAETEATVTATATNTVTGGILPEIEIGIVWKGASSGSKALILVK